MAFVDQIRQRLADGQWASGERLPSLRQMAQREQVSLHAVASAYAQLVSEGLLDVQHGRGYYVSPPVKGLPATPPDMSSASQDTAPAGQTALFRLLQAGPEYLKLGCGWLPSEWRDTEALAAGVRKTARMGQRTLTDYGDIQGHVSLRHQLAVHLRRTTRIDVPPGQLLTTVGATQALDLIIRLLVRPGDRVLLDEPCNGSLVHLVRLAGGTPVGVRRNADGPDLQALDEALKDGPPCRLFICNSTFHNPTGGTLSARTAFGMMKRAAEHGFLVVEDDVYGDFHPERRQTLVELSGLEHGIYIGSFSKSLSASLRIGHVVASPEIIDRLTELKLMTTVAVPGFCERFVNTILVDGSYARHMRELQRRMLKHQKQAQRRLAALGWQCATQPDGGMFLWIRHPQLEDLSAFITALARHGILLLPGSAFAVSQDFRAWTRINVTHLTDEAVSRMAACMREVPV